MNNERIHKHMRYILANGYEIDGEQEAKLCADTEEKIERLRSAVAAVCLDTIEGRIKQAELELKIAEEQAFLAARAERLATAEPLPPSGAWEDPFRRARERAAGKFAQSGLALFEEPLAVRLARTKLTALKLERPNERGRKPRKL
jgi:hypothetical protein